MSKRLLQKNLLGSGRHRSLLSLILTVLIVALLLFPTSLTAVTGRIKGIKAQKIVQGQSFSFYVHITPPPPPYEEIETMPLEEAIEAIERLTSDEAARILEQVSTERVAEILETMAIERAATIIAQLSIGKAADVMLAMDRNIAASVILELDLTTATQLLERMVEVDIIGAAKVFEIAALLYLPGPVSILEPMNAEPLAKLLIEIAKLPSTPETAAKLLEAESLEKAVEVVKFIIELGALDDLGKTFDHLSTKRLNDIFGELTVDERVQVLPHLTPETVARISPELVPFPDLAPTYIEVTPAEKGLLELAVEETYTVKVTVENIGNVRADRFDVRLEADGRAIQSLTVEGLAVDGTTTLSFSWTPLEPGTYDVKATVDPSRLVDELDEDNNVISTTVAVKAKALPDLTVEFTDLPERFEAGAEYEFKVLVRNIGEVEARTFSVELKADDATVGETEVENLGAGDSTTVTFTWKPTEAGDYTLRATADPGNAVTELDETTNIATTTLSVAAPPVPWIAQWGVVIVAIVVVVIIVIAALYMVTRRRRR